LVCWFICFSQGKPSGFPSLALYSQGIGGSAVFTCHAHGNKFVLAAACELASDMEEFILVNLPSRRVKAMMLHLRGSLVNIGFLTWGRILGEVGAAL